MKFTLVGATPTINQVQALIEWADTKVSENLFVTDSLAKRYPEAVAFKDTASGLVLLRISQILRHYIVWFRPEVIQNCTLGRQPQ